MEQIDGGGVTLGNIFNNYNKHDFSLFRVIFLKKSSNYNFQKFLINLKVFGCYLPVKFVMKN